MSRKSKSRILEVGLLGNTEYHVEIMIFSCESDTHCHKI